MHSNLDIHVVVFKVGIIHENICAEWVKAESRGRGVGMKEGSCEQFSTGTTETQIDIGVIKKEAPNSSPVRWVALPDHLHAWWISIQSHSLFPILRPSFCKTFSLNLGMVVKPTKTQTKTKLQVLQPSSKLHNAGPGNQDDQRRDRHSPSLQRGLLVPWNVEV